MQHGAKPGPHSGGPSILLDDARVNERLQDVESGEVEDLTRETRPWPKRRVDFMQREGFPRPSVILATGVYKGNIIPAGLKLSNTADVIGMARAAYKYPIYIDKGHPLADHVITMAYYIGLPVAWDYDAVPNIPGVRAKSGEGVTALYGSNVLEDSDRFYNAYMKSCIKAKQLIPFHQYIHGPTHLRTPVNGMSINAVIWMPSMRQFGLNVAKRAVLDVVDKVELITVIAPAAAGKTTFANKMGSLAADVDDAITDGAVKDELRSLRRSQDWTKHNSIWIPAIKRWAASLPRSVKYVLVHSIEEAKAVNDFSAAVFVLPERKVWDGRAASKGLDDAAMKVAIRSYNQVSRESKLFLNSLVYKDFNDVAALSYSKAFGPEIRSKELFDGFNEYRKLKGLVNITGDFNLGALSNSLIQSTTIVFATSGSGKSYHVESNHKSLFGKLMTVAELMDMDGAGRVLLMDGNSLVSWPITPGWWRQMTPAYHYRMTVMHLSQITLALESLRAIGFVPIAMFNPGPKALSYLLDRGRILHSFYIPNSDIAPSDAYTSGALPLFNTFGNEVSLYGQLSHWSTSLLISQELWKHNTRHVASVFALSRLGVRPVLDMHGPFIKSVRFKSSGVLHEVFASGHVLNALLSVAFPNSHPYGLKTDMNTFIYGFMRNQEKDMYSFEPTYKGVAYHSWLETYVGVLASASAIIHILKDKKAILTLRNYVAWRYYCSWILKRIIFNDRTSITVERETLRIKDPRFGPKPL